MDYRNPRGIFFVIATGVYARGNPFQSAPCVKEGGERWERRLWRIKRPERVAAVGEGRGCFVTEDIRRAPQQGVAVGGLIVRKSAPTDRKTS